MSGYRIYVHPEAWREMRELPGHVRQRVRRAVDDLAQMPRPSNSRQLDLPGTDVEARRLRLERWRIVYVVTEDDQTVDILAVRRRPPYDYGDLAAL